MLIASEVTRLRPLRGLPHTTMKRTLSRLAQRRCAINRGGGSLINHSGGRWLIRLELVAKDEHVGRCIDADADFISRDFYDRDDNRIAQSNALRFFP
jgi:hypothetical protein